MSDGYQSLMNRIKNLKERKTLKTEPLVWTPADTLDDPSLIGTGAVKYDKGKPCVYRGVIQYFPRALWGVAEISTFGAEKYAWNGWADVADGYARYQDAKFRHALLQAMGEELDQDSQKLHLKHEAWGSLAALELYEREHAVSVRN